MTRLIRSVKPEDWRLSTALDARRDRLIDAVSPETLLERVANEAAAAADSRAIQLCWEESTDTDRIGYFRVSIQIPLTEATFDQLFNGSTGYRAQYYLSPEEGILYNRDILQSLLPAIRASYSKQPLRVALELVEQSIDAPHAKIWIFSEIPAFDFASADALNPPRWVANGATRGRKAPLPGHLMVDLKGAFINFPTRDLHVDELKLDRAQDLFNKGYT